MVIPRGALTLEHSLALLLHLQGTVGEEGGAALLHLLGQGEVLVGDDALLLELLLTLLLLVRLVDGDVGGVAPVVVVVEAGHDLVVLRLLPHHHLVDTSPAWSRLYSFR